LCASPSPIVCAHAIAACSTTRRKSRDRSEFTDSLHPPVGPTLLVRRQFATRRLVLPVAEDVVGLHQLVDLARALVDDRALAVAVEAARGVFVGIAVRAVDLHAVAGGALGRDRREPLREPRLARVAAPLVLQEPRAHPQEPRRLVVALHL